MASPAIAERFYQRVAVAPPEGQRRDAHQEGALGNHLLIPQKSSQIIHITHQVNSQVTTSQLTSTRIASKYRTKKGKKSKLGMPAKRQFVKNLDGWTCLNVENARSLLEASAIEASKLSRQTRDHFS